MSEGHFAQVSSHGSGFLAGNGFAPHLRTVIDDGSFGVDEHEEALMASDVITYRRVNGRVRE
jgi:hypothetical protein